MTKRGTNSLVLLFFVLCNRTLLTNEYKKQWGTNAIDTISRQLSAELPGLKGYSATNLRLMRPFYEAWSDLFNSSAKADELRGNNSSAPPDELPLGNIEE